MKGALFAWLRTERQDAHARPVGINRDQGAFGHLIVGLRDRAARRCQLPPAAGDRRESGVGMSLKVSGDDAMQQALKIRRDIANSSQIMAAAQIFFWDVWLGDHLSFVDDNNAG